MTVDRPDRGLVNSVFGSELPQASSDERDVDMSAEAGDRERWLGPNVGNAHPGRPVPAVIGAPATAPGTQQIARCLNAT